MSWHEQAHEAMEELIDEGNPFSSDDLIARVGTPDGEHAANGANSAIGSLFGSYSRQGRIVPVGVERSAQPHRKGGMVRVWTGS